MGNTNIVPNAILFEFSLLCGFLMVKFSSCYPPYEGGQGDVDSA